MNKFLHSYIHLKAAKILQNHDEFNGYYLHCRTVSLLLWNWYCIAYDMNPKLLSMAVLLHFDFIILSPLLRDMYEVWDKKEEKRKRRKHFVENVNQTKKKSDSHWRRGALNLNQKKLFVWFTWIKLLAADTWKFAWTVTHHESWTHGLSTMHTAGKTAIT